MPDNGAQQVLKVKEVAGELRLGINQTYALIQRGEIRSVRIGRSIRVPRAALEAFLAEQEAAARAR